jgi:hypothetical protein
MTMIKHKRRILRGLHAIRRDPAHTRALFAADVEWHAQHPVNDGAGYDAFHAAAITPLLRALPDLDRHEHIFIAGEFEGHQWISAMGQYAGTFTAPLFGIPATGHLAFLRYGEFYRLDDDGMIRQIITIWDLPGLMQQAGHNPLPPSAGVEILIPGPRTRDGVMLDAVPPHEGESSKALVESMIAGLMEYDGQVLESMRQERFWHEDMTWYGPAGIGSNRRLKGFQDFHQRPFLTAFPDRRGGNHKARVGEGPYCASTGWPSIQATHAGPYLGQPATNQRITMRVMDWWRRDGDLLGENWVFIDLPHLFLQFGRDLFAEMQHPASHT